MRACVVSVVATVFATLVASGGCRAIIGVEEGVPLDDGGIVTIDGAALDASTPDTGRDAGLRDASDGSASSCVMCGSECVLTSSDTQHCGGCGRICTAIAPSTATCAIGRCVTTLAAIPGTLGPPVIANGWVYATNTNTSGIVKVPARGGEWVSIIANGAGPLVGADGASVYWSASNRLWSASIDGNDTRPMTPSFGNIVDALVHPDGLYFASGSAIRFVDIRGGDPLTLSSGTSSIASLTSDATSFYFSDSDGNVSSIPRAGGAPPLKLAWGQGYPDSVAVSASDVYWTTSSAVWRVPIGGGQWTEVVKNVSKIVIDGSTMYGRMSGAIVRIPLSGGAPEKIGPKNSSPDAIDASGLYWVENANGLARIMKVSPR